jgi:hypothetical protein
MLAHRLPGSDRFIPLSIKRAYQIATRLTGTPNMLNLNGKGGTRTLDPGIMSAVDC